MKSQTSAPGKIILFGEHFVVYGIPAILCAIDRRVKVTSEKIAQKEINIKSEIGKLKIPVSTPISQVNSPLKPFYYLADHISRKHNYKDGIEITIESEIPSGVGLGSSSACCVAAAGSISGLFEKASKEEILKLSIDAEKTIYPNTSGADCTVCTFGGIMKYDKKSGYAKINSQSNFELVIANSKIIHTTDDVVSNVKKFKEKNEDRFLNLCKNEEELIANALENLKKNDLIGLGSTISTNQKYLEAIGVSNEKLQEMIKLADSTSFGSKLTGAGGGGCIFALTDHTNTKETINKLSKKYECFSAKIDFKGIDTF